jgi:hypothetical protein
MSRGSVWRTSMAATSHPRCVCASVGNVCIDAMRISVWLSCVRCCRCCCCCLCPRRGLPKKSLRAEADRESQNGSSRPSFSPHHGGADDGLGNREDGGRGFAPLAAVARPSAAASAIVEGGRPGEQRTRGGASTANGTARSERYYHDSGGKEDRADAAGGIVRAPMSGHCGGFAHCALLCLLSLQPEFVEQLREAGARAKPYEILGPLGKGQWGAACGTLKRTVPAADSVDSAC